MSSINLTLVRNLTKGYPSAKGLNDDELTKCFAVGGFQHRNVHLYMRPHLDKSNSIDGIFVRTICRGTRAFWIKPGVLPLKDNYLHFSRLRFKDDRILFSDFPLYKGKGYLVKHEKIDSSKEGREFLRTFFADCHDLLEEPMEKYVFLPLLHLESQILQNDKIELLLELCWAP